jgi:hypothetical protein
LARNARRAERGRKKILRYVAKMINDRTQGWPIDKRNTLFERCMADVEKCRGVVRVPWCIKITPDDLSRGIQLYSSVHNKSVFVAPEWLLPLASGCPSYCKQDGSFVIATFGRMPIFENEHSRSDEAEEYFFI